MKRRGVLIVVHSDGWLEAFADSDVAVRVEMLPQTSSKRTEILAQQWLTRELPWRWRRLYWPGRLRTTAQLERLTPARLLARERTLRLRKWCQRTAKDLTRNTRRVTN